MKEQNFTFEPLAKRILNFSPFPENSKTQPFFPPKKLANPVPRQDVSKKLPILKNRRQSEYDSHENLSFSQPKRVSYRLESSLDKGNKGHQSFVEVREDKVDQATAKRQRNVNRRAIRQLRRPRSMAAQQELFGSEYRRLFG